MDVAGQVVSLPAILGLGVVVGFVAGMFGVGGGFLLNPLLSVVFKIPMPIAVGTGLCQMVGTSMVAYLRHRKLGNGEERFALTLVAGSLIGVATGAHVVARLEGAGVVDVFGKTMPVANVGLYAAYIIFLVSNAWVLWWQGSTGFEELEYVRRGRLSKWKIPPFIDLPRLPMRGVSSVVIAYVGLGLGFVSGLLGVGGGIALIPILLYGFGFPFRQAVGTGIAVTFLTAVVGTVAHAAQHNVHLGLSMVLLVGTGISAQIGAIVTTRVSARVLRKGLAVLVMLTAVVIVGDLLSGLW